MGDSVGKDVADSQIDGLLIEIVLQDDESGGEVDSGGDDHLPCSERGRAVRLAACDLPVIRVEFTLKKEPLRCSLKMRWSLNRIRGHLLK